MSRSYREPYYGNADGSKAWKREANRKLRRGQIDTGDGKRYKKFNDIWDSPMEHSGGFWDVPKMRRK